MHELNEEERARVAAQVEYFMEMIGRKYEVSPQEVIEAVRWVRERRETAAKLKATGIIGVLGLVLSSLGIALWEGIKSMILGGR